MPFTFEALTQLTLFWTHLEWDACREKCLKIFEMDQRKWMWSSTVSRVICFHMDQAFVSELFDNLASCRVLRIIQILTILIKISWRYNSLLHYINQFCYYEASFSKPDCQCVCFMYYSLTVLVIHLLMS